MPRYELIEGTSKKFWQIERDGASFTTTYGRIGTDGQSTTKDFDGEAKAKKEYEKLVTEKTKKGYRLVGGDAPTKKSTAKTKEPTTTAKTKEPIAKTKPTATAKVADAGQVPAVLVCPPWEAKPKKTTAPKPILGLAPLSHPISCAWSEGEKDRFITMAKFNRPSLIEYCEKYAGKWVPSADPGTWTEEEWRKETSDGFVMLRIVEGPEALSLEAVDEYAREGTSEWSCYKVMMGLVRWELRILPSVLLAAERLMKKAGREALTLIGPIDAAELAPIVAGVLHVKRVKSEAEGWLLRHPRAAAVGLLPSAVGGAGDAKKAALAALQALVAGGQESVVRDVAAAYGAEVATALDPLLGEDPRLTKAPPKPPAFWTAAQLPPVLLASGAALPRSALENLRIMLALSEVGRPLPGLLEALAACDARSLAAFGWALFEAWEAAGAPNDEKWAMAALAFLGDDDCARKLTPLVRKWPGESAHARAVLGLEILGAIGTDIALMSINGIAERLKFPALKELAQKQIAAIAKKKGLSVPELEDRLVPTLDLDEAGAMTLDFGSRTFIVGFDEVLTPFVRDGSGARLASLPKANAKDDAAKAKEATAIFAALKKDVRALATIQLARLERSMVAERRWTPKDFETFLVGHPLLIHTARGLVWGVYDEGKLVTTFRVAEDRTLATADEKTFTIDPALIVGIVHPTELDDATLARWNQVFAEYEILQPFPQLGRGRHTKAQAARVLQSLLDVTVPSGKVLGLTSLGWSRGAPLDSGHIGSMVRETSIGAVHLELQQGFIAGAVGENPEQTLEGFFVDRRAVDKSLLARLSTVEASELAYSVSQLTR